MSEKYTPPEVVKAAEKMGEEWPGQKILSRSERLPTLDPAPKARAIKPADWSYLVVRNPDTNEVIACTHVGHIISEIENPYDENAIESDIREQMESRDLNQYKIEWRTISPDEKEKLAIVETDLEDLTSGKSSGDYLVDDDEEYF